MLISEIPQIYDQKSKVISLITVNEIEMILSRDLKVKKCDFRKEEWDEIIEHAQEMVNKHTNYIALANVMKEGFIGFVCNDSLTVAGSG
jgi:hypothetical protein